MATHSTLPRRVGAIAAAVLASALVLAGCASGGSAPAASGGSAEAASFGDISVQYSWIKNEEFAGEFYAYENGYYDEAGFGEVTGIAGPTGGSADKPVGTVWFGWATPQGVDTEHCRFHGDRRAVREATVAHALAGLLQRLA